MTREILGEPIVPGTASGSLVKLDAPLSFWGGFDPSTGLIIDKAHPQVGVSLAGRVVAMPGSRGSSGTPGVLGESIRLGTGPIAMILTKPDINLAAGSLAATALYEATCPIVLVEQVLFDALEDGATVVTRSRSQ
ncbi:MAG: DUF126 domain-containing protein [Acidimicrobiales bacterium]|nr:DUF126 domain-containing protein [Acidimicrobiia bacterium]NNC78963.1 DUF126 domain-containing protein [Acidimicrobiales bacterium]RZV47371.1 MAG: DUF126 domain-containing protein [Acidimicrobiales bacterium]